MRLPGDDERTCPSLHSPDSTVTATPAASSPPRARVQGVGWGGCEGGNDVG